MELFDQGNSLSSFVYPSKKLPRLFNWTVRVKKKPVKPARINVQAREIKCVLVFGRA